jgi:hypothetical protein
MPTVETWQEHEPLSGSAAVFQFGKRQVPGGGSSILSHAHTAGKPKGLILIRFLDFPAAARGPLGVPRRHPGIFEYVGNGRPGKYFEKLRRQLAGRFCNTGCDPAGLPTAVASEILAWNSNCRNQTQATHVDARLSGKVSKLSFAGLVGKEAVIVRKLLYSGDPCASLSSESDN